MAPEVLYHYSEDREIERFAPHVPASNPTHPPAVWAIDAEHEPVYWFPRDCPRVTAWPRSAGERAVFERAFTTSASRVHAMESVWLGRLRSVRLHRYTFPAGGFVPWTGALGQWIAHTDVEPIAVDETGDLLARHADAGIELRIVPSLWPLHDLAVSDDWAFSIVRMSNAQPR